MSNHDAEIASTTRTVDHSAFAQNASAVTFDAMQLHKEGAAAREQLVAQERFTNAAVKPAENEELIAQNGRFINGQVRGHEGGAVYGRDPRLGVYGSFGYDPLAVPYNYTYPPALVAPQFCRPATYLRPPVCYAAPLSIPFIGREPYWRPEHRFYDEPRFREQPHWDRYINRR